MLVKSILTFFAISALFCGHASSAESRPNALFIDAESGSAGGKRGVVSEYLHGGGFVQSFAHGDL